MSLLKSAATVGGLTMASRILGFIRDQLIAFTLGTGPVAEAFFVAQRFPNLFRAMFAEGAFNSAFVPQFARKIEGEGQTAAHEFSRDMFSVLGTWLIIFSAIAMMAMPLLMHVIAPGFKGEPDKFRLAIDLTRITFPYLTFMSLIALMGGVLNSLHRFTAAAAAPIFLNLTLIGANVVAWYFGTGNSAATGYIFAWGMAVAGLVQFLLLATACWRAGMPILPRWPRLTPEVKTVARLSVPGIISAGIMQINLVIATIIASTLDRAVAYLYYADRLYQLPLGVIGVAIGVVLLPTLSRKLRAGDEAGAADAQNRALELSLFLTIPAAVALIVIARPILQTVYEHGRFSHQDTLMVVPALIAFASALPAFAMTKVFQPGFYAREDTRTPMRFAIISVVVNIAGSLILSRVFGHVGIAAATALAAWTNAIQLGLTLSRRGLFHTDARFRQRLPRILVSALVMAAVLWGLWLLLSGFYAPGAGTRRAGMGLLVLVPAGGLAHFLAAILSGAISAAELKRLLKR